MQEIDLNQLHLKGYRLNNLYRIIDKSGSSVPFRLNPVQKSVLENRHSKNLILKARQLGMSTFCVLYMLDDVIFNRHISTGIVSYSLPHAQHVFKNIVGHAFDNLPRELKPKTRGHSARELRLSHGSELRVDTSLRGGTVQNVLVTEAGKICARYPQRAEEIVSGTLEAVPKEGEVWIESTGEGLDGWFTEWCLASDSRGNNNLGQLDYRLHFFPWFIQPEYSMEEEVFFSTQENDYFAKVQSELGIKLTREQCNWYAKKWRLLGDKMQQEYPSSVSESFVSNSDAYYYASGIAQAREDRRIVQHDLYDPLLPVYVIADIGVTDMTVFTFLQMEHGEIRIIDAYADTNKGLDFYANFLLNEKRYVYDTVYLPHDARKKDQLDPDHTYERELRKLMQHTGTKVEVLKRQDKIASIGNAIAHLRHCVFNEVRCGKYISHLVKYRKKWNESLGRYVDDPYHDIHSDYGDSFRYAMQAVAQLQKSGGSGKNLERHKKAVDKRRFKY